MHSGRDRWGEKQVVILEEGEEERLTDKKTGNTQTDMNKEGRRKDVSRWAGTIVNDRKTRWQATCHWSCLCPEKINGAF